MSGRCQNFDPDAIQIQFLTILQIHIRGDRYRASHIFRQVALRIQQEILLRLPGINFHGVLSMLPGIGIRCRLQFLTATDMVKMSMGQKDCRRMQSVLSKCRLNFLSVIRGIEYQHFITVLSVYKVAVGLVDSQRHMSDTNIAHNNLHSASDSFRRRNCGSNFKFDSAISACGSLDVNDALDAPDLVNDTVQFLSAADLEGRLQRCQSLSVGSGVHGHNINIFLRQRLGNIR